MYFLEYRLLVIVQAVFSKYFDKEINEPCKNGVQLEAGGEAADVARFKKNYCAVGVCVALMRGICLAYRKRYVVQYGLSAS